MKRLFALLLLALAAGGALAPRTPRRWPTTRRVEQRLIAISEEMRCLVCQNESLAGSRAELAQDLRRECAS